MIITQNIKTITDMRRDAVGLLKHVEMQKEPTLIIYKNKPAMVLLNIKQYEKLVGKK